MCTYSKFLCVINKRYQQKLSSPNYSIRLMIGPFTTAQHGRLFRLDRGSLIHAVAPNAAVHVATPPNCFGKHVKTQNQNMQPPKTNMEPNNSWFVDVFPFPRSLFQVPCFGVYQNMEIFVPFMTPRIISASRDLASYSPKTWQKSFPICNSHLHTWKRS